MYLGSAGMYLGSAQIYLGSAGCTWVRLGCTWVRLRYTWARLDVPGFGWDVPGFGSDIPGLGWMYLGSAGMYLGSAQIYLGSAGCTWVRLGCTWVRLRYTWARLDVPGFGWDVPGFGSDIPGLGWMYLGSAGMYLGSAQIYLGSAGCTWVRLGCTWVRLRYTWARLDVPGFGWDVPGFGSDIPGLGWMYLGSAGMYLGLAGMYLGPRSTDYRPMDMESVSDPLSSLYRVLVRILKPHLQMSEDHQYTTPRRAVTSVEDMDIWKESEAYSLQYIELALFPQEIVGFIIALNEAVKGKPLTIDCLLAEVPQNLLALLNKLDLWLEETPPVEQPQRFGNKAFRTWFDRLKREALELLQRALPEQFHRAVPEVMFYLVEGFGNSTRIDYGTGHELAFLMFLCCLFKIGALKSLDQEAVVTKVFNRYLQLVRKLQLTYRMEPAGSHGVWSLDDYQFIPFIWGSSQLIGKAVILKGQGSLVHAHPRIEPRSFLQEDVVNSYADDYMFLGCIQFINKVKILGSPLDSSGVGTSSSLETLNAPDEGRVLSNMTGPQGGTIPTACISLILIGWKNNLIVKAARLIINAVLKKHVVELLELNWWAVSLQVKTGMFAEHSNQLWNISGVGSWSKVNSGLIKMYKAEVSTSQSVGQHWLKGVWETLGFVLAKFPLVQHVLFGSLLPFRPVERQQPGVHCVRMSMTPPPPPRFLPPDKDDQ
uniref:Serine/threonine-protein phosphatase 2A activator n=1 Tax=Timema cristinae TaxID=61476 RepID=A0A7R9CSQ4_TIMCR|nr:unnamed protein product [Timema cristinae]